MAIKLQMNFDTNEFEEYEMDNSLNNWCKENNCLDLLEEWDYEKNGDVTPKNITYGNDFKAWWKKEYDDPRTGKHFVFSWKSSISHRKAGEGCPYLCEPTKKIYVGFNDLATTNPELVEEWDYEKNTQNNLFIESVSRGSTKRAYWICKIHGSYDAVIVTRTRGDGCPYCSSRRVMPGFNDLKTMRPDLAREWDYEKNNVTPEEVPYGSIKKYWWKCSKGHSWLVSPNSRSGCPVCGNKQILVGYNDLATTNPRVAAEWNYEKNSPLTPRDFVSMSNKKVWWKCKFGHDYQARIATKVAYNAGCSICNKERQTSFSEKAVYFYLKKYIPTTQENYKFDWLGKMEIDIYIPEFKLGLEYDGYHWHRNTEKDLKKDQICSEHNIKLIRIREEGCPDLDSASIKITYGPNSELHLLDDVIRKIFDYLSQKYSVVFDLDINIDRDYMIIMDNYITREKENSLSKLRPDLAKEWNYKKNGSVTPEFISLHSNKPFWWTCPKCNNSYQMVVNERTGGKKSNCPICASKRIIEGYNDLATTYPELLKEWDYEKNIIKPSEISAGSQKKIWWKCSKGHSWESQIYVRTKMNCGCPYCSHLLASEDNNFAVLYPELLTEWNFDKNDVNPHELLPKSNKRVWWKCKNCSYEWQQTVAHRTMRGYRCPLCANQVLVRGINDLETQYPEIAKEWDYERNTIKPYEVSGGTNKKYWWKCSKCGNEWECVVASRTKRGSKCPNCRNNNVQK